MTFKEVHKPWPDWTGKKRLQFQREHEELEVEVEFDNTITYPFSAQGLIDLIDYENKMNFIRVYKI